MLTSLLGQQTSFLQFLTVVSSQLNYSELSVGFFRETISKGGLAKETSLLLLANPLAAVAKLHSVMRVHTAATKFRVRHLYRQYRFE
jgi:hypothetical protein